MTTQSTATCSKCLSPVQFVLLPGVNSYQVACWCCGNLLNISVQPARTSPPSFATSSSPPPSSSSSTPSSSSSFKASVDTEFYDTLGVAPTATASEIKKAYYKMSRKYHPDKNPDDADATARFQKIGEAYQVLSDEKKRKLYDEKGKDAALNDSAGQFHAAADLFRHMFGGPQFGDFFGDIVMLSLFGSDEELGPDERAEIIRREVLALTVKLLEMLRPGLKDVSSAQFMAHMRIISENLLPESLLSDSAASSDIELALLLSNIYIDDAKVHLGGVSGFFSGIKSFGKTAGSLYKTVKAVADLSATQSQMAEAQRCGDESFVHEQEEKLMDRSVSAVYRLIRWDIERALHRVCTAALTDGNANDDLRRRRAVALKALGQRIKDRANLMKAKLKNVKSKANSAKNGAQPGPASPRRKSEEKESSNATETQRHGVNEKATQPPVSNDKSIDEMD